jgi:NifB/MoaA-like Fe-S oxidoreductase
VRSISVVPVGITKHHKYGLRPNTLAEARLIFDKMTSWQEKLLAELGARFVYLTDEWYLVLEEPIPPAAEYDDLALQENGLGMVRDFLDAWQTVKGQLARDRSLRPEAASGGVQRATLVTGALFARTLEQVAAEFSRLTGISLEVAPMVNQRLGETITVSGLLMGQDVIDQLRGRDLGGLVVMPRIMFDHPDGISLDDVAPDQIAGALNRPVVLADGMHDVWDAVSGAD